MKTFKMITWALVIMALVGVSSMAFAAAKKEVICTQIGKKHNIVNKSVKKDITYNVWPCDGDEKATAQSKQIK